MSRQDPKGYYALLGVIPTASASEIKAAFRQRAKQLHPDLNSSPYAAQEFQQLNEAYSIVVFPETRAQYDTSGVEVPQYQSQTFDKEPLEPLTCSLCRKVTAQPRYVIFYDVKSFLIITIRTPVQGIFCRSCAEEKALRSTIVTWVFGWWGFPWGVVFSIQAIIHNLLGGSKPNDINARLLTYQAHVFATQGKFDLARAVGANALDLSHKIKPGIFSKTQNTSGHPINDEGASLRIVIDDLLRVTNTGKPIERLANNWSLLGRAFYLQCGIIAAAITITCSFLLPSSESSTQTLSSPKTTLNLPQSPKPGYVRPRLADNGTPFPRSSGYIDGYPLNFSDGYSSVTIDNSQNGSDVFIKLFSLDQ